MAEARDADKDGRSSHRLAAIVSADVAGYSRLVAEDEEATIAAVLRQLNATVPEWTLEFAEGFVRETQQDPSLVEPVVALLRRICM